MWILVCMSIILSVATAKVDDSLLGLVEEEPYLPEENSVGCKCVPYFLCRDGEIVTDGADLINIRLGVQKCKGVIDVCCNTPSDAPRGPVHPPFNPQCGVRNKQGIHVRIAFTDEEKSATKFGEFPWHTAILKQEYDEAGNLLSVYTCGGSLIHEQVVLTVAHCVDNLDASTLQVRAGSWDIQDPQEPYQERNVEKVLIKEDYKPRLLHNDMALLFLEKPFELSPHINTICLPDPYDTFPAGMNCTATGWGKHQFGDEGNFQSVLKKVDLPLMSHADCTDAFRSTVLGPFFSLHESFRCAGGSPGEDTCQGDGGSPLVCEDPDTGYYHQIGMVAWGIGCGGDGIPGAYADVVNATVWINSAVKQYFLM